MTLPEKSFQVFLQKHSFACRPCKLSNSLSCSTKYRALGWELPTLRRVLFTYRANCNPSAQRRCRRCTLTKEEMIVKRSMSQQSALACFIALETWNATHTMSAAFAVTPQLWHSAAVGHATLAWDCVYCCQCLCIDVPNGGLSASLRRGQAVTQPCRWQGHLLLHSYRHGIQTTDIVSCTMLLYLINRACCMSTLVRGHMFCNQNLWPRCQGPGSHVLFFQPNMWPLYVTVFFHMVSGVSQFISRTKSLLEVTCSFSQPQPVTSVPRA